MGKNAKLKAQRKQETFNRIRAQDEIRTAVNYQRMFDRFLINKKNFQCYGSVSPQEAVLIVADTSQCEGTFEMFETMKCVPPFPQTVVEVGFSDGSRDCVVFKQENEGDNQWDVVTYRDDFDTLLDATTYDEEDFEGEIAIRDLKGGVRFSPTGEMMAFLPDSGVSDFKGSSAVFMALWVLSVCHCKNVALVDALPDTQASQLHEKHFGIPLTKYKTLRIKPMGKRSNSDPKEYQDLMPLHLRRGNFATYTEDAPLFGKFTGTFWRPATVVGSEKNGAVVKDYEVAPQ